jgi:hypothetical protein
MWLWRLANVRAQQIERFQGSTMLDTRDHAARVNAWRSRI